MTGAVDADEIARARSMLRASMLMSLESPAARIESAAGQLFRDGHIMSADEITARLDAVAESDIRRVAASASEGPVALSLVGAVDVDRTAIALAK